MRVLVIGAGAIGQVFGYSFARGGAEVAFLTRPRQASGARAGFTLYPMNRPAPQRANPIPFRPFAVFDQQDRAMQSPWDLVVLAVSSLALRSGDWFEALCGSLGDAHLLSLLPGSDDPQYVLQRLPPARVSWGLLSLMSFQAPLPGQDLPKDGVAFWYPWRSSLAFSGPPPVTDQLTDVLRAGGMPVRRVESVPRTIAYTGPILAHIVTALECSGWELSVLIADRPLLELAVGAMRETWRVATAIHGVDPPFGLRFMGVTPLRVVLTLAPHGVPFDLQRFLSFHYRKVGEQHLFHLRKQVQACDAHGVESPCLRALLSRLEEVRA